MSAKLREDIIRNLQIKKFCIYGLLKNLKFFEPYLLIYLMSQGINLFQIGVLIGIREVVVNIMEIPSGFIADYFGRKKELYVCFSFYIMSFIVFFFTNTFALAAVGMIFFGLGEAFRSGTHKAMIYTYLDHKGWEKEKTFVYGRTRSFSLIGSAISSLLGIALILCAPTDRYIFLFSVIPYVFDLLLIMTYPAFLDTADKKHGATISDMVTDLINAFRLNKKLRHIMLEEGMSEAAYSYIKDFIQPILESILVGSGILLISNISAEDNLKIVLGLVYAVLNLCGSYFSKKTYTIKGQRTSIECLYFIHISYAITCGLLAVCSGQYIVVCILYILFYVLHSVRKPLYVDEIDNHMDKSNRATVISATSQFKSICLMIGAPILGFIADSFGIKYTMIILCVIFALTIPLLNIAKKES